VDWIKRFILHFDKRLRQPDEVVAKDMKHCLPILQLYTMKPTKYGSYCCRFRDLVAPQ
jgi:hypothetical protein